jgi:hypothetical protein
VTVRVGLNAWYGVSVQEKALASIYCRNPTPVLNMKFFNSSRITCHKIDVVYSSLGILSTTQNIRLFAS